MHGVPSVSIDAWKASQDPLEQAGWFWAWMSCPMDTRRQRCTPVDQAWAQRTAQAMVSQLDVLAKGLDAWIDEQHQRQLSIEGFEQLVRVAPSLRSPPLEALIWKAGEAVAERVALLMDAKLAEQKAQMALMGDADPSEVDLDEEEEDELDDEVDSMYVPGLRDNLYALESIYRRPTLPLSPAHIPFLRGLVALRAVLEHDGPWSGGHFKAQAVPRDWADPLFAKVSALDGLLTLTEAERWLQRWAPRAPHPVHGFLEQQVFVLQVNQTRSEAPARQGSRSRL
jgi:hypothetical protein